MNVLSKKSICIRNYFYVGYVDTTGVTNRGIGFNIKDLCYGLRLVVEWDVVCDKLLSPEDVIYVDDRCKNLEWKDNVEYISSYDYIKYISIDGVMKLIDFACEIKDDEFVNIDHVYYRLHPRHYWAEYFLDIKDWFKDEAPKIKCGTVETKYDFLAKYGFEFNPLRTQCIKVIVPFEEWIVVENDRLGVHYQNDFLAIPFSGKDNELKNVMDIFNFDWESPKTALICSNLIGLGFKGENTHFRYTNSECNELCDDSYSEKWYMEKDGFKTIELKTLTRGVLDLHIISEDLDWEYKGHVTTLEKLKMILDLFGIDYNKQF